MSDFLCEDIWPRRDMVINGVIFAENKREAIRKLAASGLMPLSIKEESSENTENAGKKRFSFVIHNY
jgi:type II secretory pathway component PulF